MILCCPASKPGGVVTSVLSAATVLGDRASGVVVAGAWEVVAFRVTTGVVDACVSGTMLSQDSVLTKTFLSLHKWWLEAIY